MSAFGDCALNLGHQCIQSYYRAFGADAQLTNAQKRPYTIEQLHVCTLLTNCYVCMNCDVAGSDNTFGLSPPMLSEYLRL